MTSSMSTYSYSTEEKFDYEGTTITSDWTFVTTPEGSAPSSYWQLDAYTAVFTYCPPVILILGTISNILAIVILQSKKMRASGTNFILTTLAFADLGVLYTTLLRSWILQISNRKIDVRGFNIHACRVHLFFTYVFTQLSPMTLALITLERVISVCLPLRAREICRRSNTIKIWLALLIVLAGYNMIAFFTVTNENKLASAGFKCNFNDKVFDTVYTIHNVLSSYLPCIVIFLGNGVIVYKLIVAERRRSEKMQASEASSTTASTTRMLVVVSVTFLLTTVPVNVYITGQSIWPINSPDPLMRANSLFTYSVLYNLFCLNNAVNFFLYIAFGKSYRKALVQVMCCRPYEPKRTTQMSTLSRSMSMSKTSV